MLSKNIFFFLFSLLSLSVFCQTKKHGCVLSINSPFKMPYHETTNNLYNTKQLIVQTSINYFLSDKFSVGINLIGRFNRATPIVSSNSSIYSSYRNDFAILPEIKYNFFKSRFTPFLRLTLFSEFDYSTQHIDSPTFPINFQTTHTYSYYTFFDYKNFIPDVGVNFFLSKKIGIFVIVYPYSLITTPTSNNGEFGCQIVIK